MNEEQRVQILLRLKGDRYLAHQMLFEHRHGFDTPAFHREVVKRWHSADPYQIFMLFRDSAKTTISEEAVIIRALFMEFHNCLLLGESETRAIERLAAIKHEFETNEVLEELFGPSVGPTWRENKIVLPNNVCIQAIGSGQSLRGIKHLDKRPDLVLIDDVEGDKDAFTPTQREKTRQWFMATVLPAASLAMMRMTTTPLDAESLPVTLSHSPAWKTFVIPIKTPGPPGSGVEWVSSWPSKFSLQWIEEKEEMYRVTGNYEEFEREYMVRAIAERDRPFKQIHFRSEPVIRTWHPVDVMYDPARTVNTRTSAMTGKAVWSWQGTKLIVWESGGYFWLPNEIIDDIVKVATRYNPVTIGVEQDGLNEFLLQPLRQRQIQEGVVWPIKPMKAPRSKLDFIKQSLQPYFNAGEVVFVGDGHGELQKQLLNYPTGRNDVPNALAYALLLRPGSPVYKEFGDRHCAASPLPFKKAEVVWCVLNANEEMVSATIVVYQGERLYVIADYIREGRPVQAIPGLLRSIAVDCGRPVRLAAPEKHFTDYDTIGLATAVARAGHSRSNPGGYLQLYRLPGQLGPGNNGAVLLREALLGEGGAQFQLFKATWTIRALAGGYNTSLSKSENSPYKLVIEALEGFMGRLQLMSDDRDVGVRYAETPDGRRYLTSLP